MRLYYEKAKYAVDDTLAIQTWCNDEGYFEPYGRVTVNLSEYGMKPEEGYIFIPTYNMTYDFYRQVYEDIIEEVIAPVRIGFGEGVYAKLKENWEDNVTMLDEVKGEA